MLKDIFSRLIRGTVYSAALSVVGAAFSLLKGWPLLKGAYIFVLSGGVFTVLVSVFMLIGTPDMRKKMMQKKGTDNEAFKGGEGISPAVMGVFMIAVGFFLESLMH